MILGYGLVVALLVAASFHLVDQNYLAFVVLAGIGLWLLGVLIYTNRVKA